MEEKIHRFSDFADAPTVLDGPKVKIEDVLDREITVIGYKFSASKYDRNGNRCLTVHFQDADGKRKVFFTGSSVLIEQMEKYGDKVPFRTILRKVDKYYTFS